LAQRLQVRSVNFLGRRPYDALPAMIAASDLCLGIFGTSPKAQRVIPNKVFDALACGRAVVTADTPAARELLHPGGDAWLCEAGSPEAIADAVSTLREDDHLRVAIAERGHARFRESAGIDALAHRLAGIMHEVRRTPAA
jgi:glycosyltransferase involved in cell wall biosynthesis